MRTTPDGKGILASDSDLEEGTEIQFMTIDSNQARQVARESAAALIMSVTSEGKVPLFGLYIGSTEKRGDHLDRASEEHSEVKSLFDTNGVPLFDFGSRRKVVPFFGRYRAFDLASILVVFQPREK